jgi:hypothetical protein
MRKKSQERCMKKIALLILCVIFLAPSLLLAEGDQKKQLASELLKTMDMKKQFKESYESMTKQFFPMLMQQIQAQMAKVGKTDEAAMKKIEAVHEKASKLVAQEMSWKNIKQDQIELYASTFGEKELKDLNKFFKTETGKKFLDKQQEILRKSFQISQKHLQSIMPKLNTLLEKELPELKAQSQKQSPPPLPKKAE